MDRTFVSQLDRGVGNQSLRILCKLADQLQTTVAQLLRGQCTEGPCSVLLGDGLLVRTQRMCALDVIAVEVH
ncbi:hypothetical protein MW290_28085 [Aquincola tertiaricarbonis]|uniref:Uncharacterized protein n=1 Tax=Aquincola tertiaricarbonis TaxID=391953 RepID=A0ABY4S7V1_AQUTE|nr:hypothetical protein [Aquincola tertiaricarbonis]URI09427.1 hypothetical protein MW290_28085 [Aquincola tertiaricarbonis]